MMNKSNLIGRLTKDAEILKTDEGLVYARYTLAIGRNISKEKKKTARQDVDFIPCVVFGDNKEDKKIMYTIVNMKQGCLVAVEGRLSSYNRKDESGQWKSGLSVVVEHHWLLRTPMEKEDQGQSVNRKSLDSES